MTMKKDILTGNTVLSGERNPNAKLKDAEVIAIREKYETGNYTMVEIGEMFGVSRRTISSIINKNLWTHIK
jgi:uncharacterized protein YjcR